MLRLLHLRLLHLRLIDKSSIWIIIDLSAVLLLSLHEHWIILRGIRWNYLLLILLSPYLLLKWNLSCIFFILFLLLLQLFVCLYLFHYLLLVFKFFMITALSIIECFKYGLNFVFWLYTVLIYSKFFHSNHLFIFNFMVLYIFTIPDIILILLLVWVVIINLRNHKCRIISLWLVNCLSLLFIIELIILLIIIANSIIRIVWIY